MRFLLYLLGFAGLTVGQQAEAQSIEAPPAPLTWAVWGGLAQNSPGTLWGAEKGRDIAVLALRVAKPLALSRSVRLDYAVDVVPALWVSMPPPPLQCGPPRPGGACNDYRVFDGSEGAWGAGIAPLGLQAELLPGWRVRPYFSMNAGLVYFRRPVPVEGASRLNFTADAGVGLRVALSARWQGALGYKFYHISNGGTAQRNPGLDGHMVVIGIQRRR